MIVEGDKVTLSSGRIFYANRGIIGINPDMDEVFDGFDGSHFLPDPKWVNPELTPAEAVEIADFMLKLWAVFKKKFERIREEKV